MYICLYIYIYIHMICVSYQFTGPMMSQSLSWSIPRDQACGVHNRSREDGRQSLNGQIPKNGCLANLKFPKKKG